MKRFFNSLGFAFSGIIQSWKIGQNFKIQVGCGVVSLVLCILLNVQGWEWIVVLILIGGVLALKVYNLIKNKI